MAGQLRFIDQNGRVLSTFNPETEPLVSSGIYDLIVEGEGILGVSKIYLQSIVPILDSGSCIVRKRQLNVKCSDDDLVGQIKITFTDLNNAVDNAVLVHNFGKSENAIAFKVVAKTIFAPSPIPVTGEPSGARIYQSAPTAIAASNDALISFQEVSYDDAAPNNLFDIALPTKLTIKKAGRYFIMGSVNYAEAGNSSAIITINLNTVPIANQTTEYSDPLVINAAGFQIMTTYDLIVGDVLELHVVNDTLVPHTTNTGIAQTWFTANLIK